MDRAISASDANRNFSSILRDVKSGESFVVESRGRPVARIVPIEEDNDRRAAARARLREHWAELGDKMTVIAPWTREELYERD